MILAPRRCTPRRALRPFATASDAMPAPGPKDGHMSRSSRDLSKGIAVKSNGFKHGGGSTEGWGTKNTGRRLGKGQGARDVAARARLKEVLLRRAKEVAEGGSSAGKKRKRVDEGTTGDDARGKRARDEAAVAPAPRDPPVPSRPVDPLEASDASSPPTPLPTPLSRMGDTPASRAACVAARKPTTTRTATGRSTGPRSRASAAGRCSPAAGGQTAAAAE